MHYLVGDLQGCCSAFDRLLQHIDFSPSRDEVTVLGDLVNRGPESLRTLERLRSLGAAANCLLGNHDLNLLAVAHGIRRPGKSDTLNDILTSPERDAWIEWLSERRLAIQQDGWLLVHAGVPPAWSAADTLARAAEVETQLRGDDLPGFLSTMYGNAPDRWDDALRGPERTRFIVNALTRMRYVRTADGAIDLSTSGPPDQAPAGLLPWFEVPGRRTEGTPIAFGHWSALGLIERPDLLALDTGCVWGGQLTAARIDGGHREIVQVPCEQARKPG